MSFTMGIRIGMPRGRGGATPIEAGPEGPAEEPTEPAIETPVDPVEPTPTEPVTETPTDPTPKAPEGPETPTESVDDPAAEAGLVSIEADGWQAIHTDPDAFVPQTITVSRAGFDRTATPVVHTDAVRLTTRVRAPFPDHATLTTDRVALSEFVYATDAITGVENRSTRPAPKPVAMWLTPDMTHVTTSTATVRLAVAHGHARHGAPVAAVRFEASDGSIKTEVLVSTMTTVTYDASGFSIPCYEGALDFSGLAEGVVTVDAVIYPWVGAPFRVSVDADAYPSPNLCPLKVVNDRAGGVGTAHAWVETGGDDATGAAAADASAARATPFATIPAAVAALRAFNAATHGRDDAGGGTVHLGAGIHIHGSFRSQAGPTEIPLMIAGTDGAVYQDKGASVTSGLPPRVVLRDLTLRKNGDRVIFLDSGASSPEHLLRLERVTVDLAGQSDYAAWIYRVGRLQLVDTICENDAPRFFSTAAKCVVAVGSRIGALTNLYAAAASRLARASEPSPAGANPPVVGRFLGHCHVSGFGNGQTGVTSAAPMGPRGVAIVGCVIEATASDTSPALWIHADGNTAPCENAVVIANTVVGARTNLFYQDTGSTTIAKSGYLRLNVLRERNIKADVFGRDGALTGNWSAVHCVCAAGNVMLLGSSSNDDWEIGSWLGEVRGVDEATGTDAAPIDPGWARDASFDGTREGGGDYTPSTTGPLPAVPAEVLPFASDQAGRALAGNGTAVPGALQPA